MQAKFKKQTSLVTGFEKSVWLPLFALRHILSLPALKTRLEGVSEFYHRECLATEGWAALLCDGWLALKESKPNASKGSICYTTYSQNSGVVQQQKLNY